jgi:hypothetical protein
MVLFMDSGAENHTVRGTILMEWLRTLDADQILDNVDILLFNVW